MDSTITIHKSLFGFVAILLASWVLGAVAYFGSIAAFKAGYVDAVIFTLGIAVSTLSVLLGAVAAYVYWLSTITIAPDTLTMRTWVSLFYDQDAECKWSEIEDVTVTSGGVFAQIFGYGTLLVQTAASRPNFRFTMVPHADEVQELILARSGTTVSAQP